METAGFTFSLDNKTPILEGVSCPWLPSTHCAFFLIFFTWLAPPQTLDPWMSSSEEPSQTPCFGLNCISTQAISCLEALTPISQLVIGPVER